jgi:hypothetical protein
MTQTEENLNANIHIDHCSKCYNFNKCVHKHDCKLIECSNNCGVIYHACKNDEHLAETCSNSIVDCPNLTNGCKLKLKRADIARHLSGCVASVVRCSSFRVRRIINKNEKFTQLKWPDPINSERLNILNNNIAYSYHQDFNNNNNNSCSLEKQNINRILLEQDIASLKDFALKYPLKFHRMYGYLIGLKIFKDYSQPKFSFMRHLLKNVKSKVFKDIETENCIVWNDEEGCAACQSRIRMLESARFAKLKEDRFHFGQHLREIRNFEEFVEQKIYSKFEFKQDYKEFYLKPLKEEEELIKKNSNETNEETHYDKEELFKKLLQNNQELINAIELDRTLKVNVAQELPCEAFALQYESYRTKETTFCIDCDQMLRRDEYSPHYALYHNYLLSNAEQIDLNCPMREYGCDYFKQQVEFFYGNKPRSYFNHQHVINTQNRKKIKKIDFDYPSASLVHNKLSNNLTFKLDYLNCGETNCYVADVRDKNILDLPFEVMYEIIDHLDSLSLYSLSMTSKVNDSAFFCWLRN